MDNKTHYEIIKEAFDKCGIEYEDKKHHYSEYPYIRFPDNEVAQLKGNLCVDLDFDFNSDGSFNKIEVSY